MDAKKTLEKLSVTKINEHITLSFSMCSILLFKDMKDKHDVYRGKECMKVFQILKETCNEDI